MGLPPHDMSWLIPTCMVWGVGFVLACANLRDHFQGECNGRKVYKWPPRPFRERTCLMPLWPVVFFLPAVLWPIWVVVSIIRQQFPKDADADADADLELQTLRPSRRFPAGPWEGRARKGVEIERRSAGGSGPGPSCVSEPPPAYEAMGRRGEERLWGEGTQSPGFR
ncbi:hypothetical protein VMCG_05449 [Cytospora schulzeri]|uniref:Transmembrane protein n=1 Tax=Cytospora schulzeri TaxID=448051 RepID=A0A423WK45_9PEZI|nr:hypothetical protein VMCG_05449 [Valsa malicola]